VEQYTESATDAKPLTSCLYFEFRHVREVRLAQLPVTCSWAKKTSRDGSFGRPPLLHAALQRSQLTVRTLGRTLALQRLDFRLCLPSGVGFDLLPHLFRPQRIRARSACPVCPQVPDSSLSLTTFSTS
jgi:hypothetical protein